MTSIPGTKGIAGGVLNLSTAGCILSDLPFGWEEGFPTYHAPNGRCYPYFPDTGRVVQFAQYGYNPKLYVGVIFCVLFGLLAVVHVGLALKSRRKWLLVTALGAGVELAGWVGRALSGKDNGWSIAASNYFLCQICCLTIAPVFFSATVYGLFVILVNGLDTSFSRFSPRLLTYIFVGCDFVSLVLQGAGGGITSTANTRSQQQMGTHIFLSGIVFQLVVMIIFSIIYVDYFLRLRIAHHKVGEACTPPRLMVLAAGTAFASFTIIVRGIYRTAELAEGWEGYLINTESWFLGFDASFMVLCLTVLAVTHPAFTFPKVPIAPDVNSEKKSRSLAFWKKADPDSMGAIASKEAV